MALTPTAFAFAFVTSAIVCVLAAMISRNVYLIFKTSVGETWFSKGSTPFQLDNIHMVREIGIFAISILVVELVISIIAGVVLGPDCVEMSVNTTGVFFGLVALALSRYFSYGAELQSEVDGLV